MYGARGIFRGGRRGLIMGDPMMLSTPTGDVRKGLWGGGPATGLAASPAGMYVVVTVHEHDMNNMQSIGTAHTGAVMIQAPRHE